MSISRREFLRLSGEVAVSLFLPNDLSRQVFPFPNVVKRTSRKIELTQAGPENNILQTGNETIDIEGTRYHFTFNPSAVLTLITDVAKLMHRENLASRVVAHLNRHELELRVTDEFGAIEEGKFIPPDSFDNTRKTRSVILLKPRVVEAMWRIGSHQEKSDWSGTDIGHLVTFPHEVAHFIEYAENPVEAFARINREENGYQNIFWGEAGGAAVGAYVAKRVNRPVLAGALVGALAVGIPSACGSLNSPDLPHSNPIYKALQGCVDQDQKFKADIIGCAQFKAK